MEEPVGYDDLDVEDMELEISPTEKSNDEDDSIDELLDDLYGDDQDWM